MALFASRKQVRSFLDNDLGATSIEYCIMASLVIFVCIVGIAIFGVQVLDLFSSSNDAMTSAFGG